MHNKINVFLGITIENTKNKENIFTNQKLSGISINKK